MDYWGLRLRNSSASFRMRKITGRLPFGVVDWARLPNTKHPLHFNESQLTLWLLERATGIEAIVAAHAADAAQAVVFTSDPTDLRRLLVDCPWVTVGKP